MTGFFHVKNFETFQHYKDRSPPWIKFYNTLLRDIDHAELPDASKSHLHAIWLLASCTNNQIPWKPEWIAGQIGATEKVDLMVLAEAGFIVPDQECSKLLATRQQSACLETERETEVEEETKDEVSLAKKSDEIDLTIPDDLKFENRSKGNGDVRKRAKPRRRVPPDWEPTPFDGRGYASDRGLDINAEAEQFRNHHIAKGTLFADIDAAWRTWCNNAVKFAAERVANRPGDRGSVAVTRELLAEDKRAGRI